MNTDLQRLIIKIANTCPQGGILQCLVYLMCIKEVAITFNISNNTGSTVEGITSLQGALEKVGEYIGAQASIPVIPTLSGENDPEIIEIAQRQPGQDIKECMKYIEEVRIFMQDREGAKDTKANIEGPEI